MLQHIAFISSKSGIDPCRDGMVIGLIRKECRRTDGFSAYIVIYECKDLLNGYIVRLFSRFTGNQEAILYANIEV